LISYAKSVVELQEFLFGILKFLFYGAQLGIAANSCFVLTWIHEILSW